MQADGDRRETDGTAGPDCVIAIVPDGQEIGRPSAGHCGRSRRPA